jgi:hypothetical protein
MCRKLVSNKNAGALTGDPAERYKLHPQKYRNNFNLSTPQTKFYRKIPRRPANRIERKSA